MGYFDHVLMSGPPPIGLDLDLGGALSAIALLLASLLAILCIRESNLGRMISAWRSGAGRVASVERPAEKRPEPITLARAFRLTTGPRK
jgi:hypothetical protein